MRVGIWISIILATSILLTSCGSVGPIVTMTGEMVSVRLRNGNERSVELVAVEDSSILCLTHVETAEGGGSPPAVRIEEIPAASITQITVAGFRNDSWWRGVLIFEVLPAIGLTVAAASTHADAGAVFGASIIPACFTALLYAGSGVPTPTFEDPILDKDLLELRKYARFGGKLTAAQKEQLLRTHVQGEVQ